MESKSNSKKKLRLLLSGVLLLTIVAGLGIGLMLSKDDGAFAFDVKPVRHYEFEEVEEKEQESNHILDATVLGLWNDGRLDGGSFGPAKSYDNKKASRWNPNACTDFVGDPAIVYLLDGYYDMDTWEMMYTVRECFFDMYVSKDGKDFKLVKQVTKDNYKKVYAEDGDKFICTLDNLDAKDIAFVKIVFTGSNHEKNSPWISLNAVKCIGTRLGDGPEEMPEFDDPYKITPMDLEYYELIGEWHEDQTKQPAVGPEKVYDGNIYSSWNPGVKARFEGDPGIIYKLRNAQDIKKMQLYFSKYKHYFDVYVSKDGKSYTPVAKISFANEDKAYTQDKNKAYICTLDGLALKDIQYIKLMFTGRDDGGLWLLLNEVVLHEEGASGIDTSWMMKTEPDSKHPWIAACKLIGKWKNDREKDLSWTRYKTYDEDMNTFWNPEAEVDYVGEPGIVYTLKKAMNLKKLQFNFGKNIHYFDVFVSKDGTSYTQIAEIVAKNENKAYTVDENGIYTCTLDGLDEKDVKYIKIIFTNRKNRSNWVSLYETIISDTGTNGLDTSWMMPSKYGHPSIKTVDVIGEWKEDRATSASWSKEKVFDEDNVTFWNPEANASYVGEPGIIFTLNKAMNLQKMQFDFGKNVHYFDVFVSRDGETYTQIADISATNEKKAYANGTGLCTLDGLTLENIKYVKLVFTGRKTGSTWVSFYEASFSTEGTSGLDTSWMLPGGSGDGGDTTDEGNVVIKSSSLVGQWLNAQVGTSYSPLESYDDNKGTFWNPGANSGYAGAPGIVYTLENEYDITKLKMTFDIRYFYFDVEVSTDGSTYTPIASVDATNYATYYTDGYICTIDNLSAKNVKYIKFVFTGDSQNRCWISFNELDAYGEISEDSSEDAAITIVSGTPVGEWNMDRVGSASVPPEFSYDDSQTTMWNPEAKTGYAGNPGIVYTLDKEYDLTEITLVHKHRHYYYSVAVSADGESYTTIATVDATTAPNYYTTDNTCVLAVDAKNVKYVKLTFTGNAQNGNLYLALYDVSLKGSVSAPKEPVKPVITNGVPVGEWNVDRVGSASVPPLNSYDNSQSSMWNPEAKDGYAGNPGIVYTLDQAYDLTKLTLVHKHRHYYYSVEVSADGESYTTIATVDATTAPNYFNSDNTCVLTVDAKNVKYIKLTFTGNAQAGNKYVALYDISLEGDIATQVEPEVPTVPTITSGTPVGEWEMDRVTGDTQNPPEYAYDDSASTMWNPQAKASYAGNPGIVFTLKDAMTLQKLQFNFGNNVHYFDVFISTDGSEYTQIADITAANEANAYPDGNGLCTLDGLNLENVKYVKLVFSGRKTGSVWVSLFDVSLSTEGTSGLDTSWMMPTVPDDDDDQQQPESVDVTITNGTPVGTWVLDRVGSASVPPLNSYDNSMSSMWNPQANSTAYNSGEGIVYTLDKAYNLTKLSLTFKRNHYFQVLVSEDGTNYAAVALVDANNASTYYTVVDATNEVVCCDINVGASNVKYVKLLFTGNIRGNDFVALYDIKAQGVAIVTNEVVKATVTTGTPVGTWVLDRVGSASVPPEYSYDSSTTTMWNPQANSTAYNSGEGIVYTLDKAYDLTKLSLTFKRNHYFQVLVSADGTNYSALATVNAENAATYYTVVDAASEVVRCDMNVNVTNVRYVKLLFAGNVRGNDFVALYDIAAHGCVAVPKEVVKATVANGTPIGTWVLDRVGSASVPPEYSYDGSTTTMWNPQANSASYNSGEGIVYTLDKAYDLAELWFTYKRNHYFQVLVSADGTNYTALATVNADNAASYYTVVDAANEVVRCQMNVSATNIKYVKLTFAGNVRGNDFVALYDISVLGSVK